MDAEYSKVSSTSQGVDGWMRTAESILREASTELRGWTVTEGLRDSYLQPLRDHGDVLKARLVSWESRYLLVCIATSQLCHMYHYLGRYI